MGFSFFIKKTTSCLFSILASATKDQHLLLFYSFTDDLLSTTDQGKVTGAIYLDLNKAFDTVNHSVLLRKLEAYGVYSPCIKCFRSYHTHRTQCTVVGDVSFSFRNITIGALKGPYWVHFFSLSKSIQFCR